MIDDEGESSPARNAPALTTATQVAPPPDPAGAQAVGAEAVAEPVTELVGTPTLPQVVPVAAPSVPAVPAIGGRLGRTLGLRSAAASPERELIFEQRDPLIYMLCDAAELEHMLMCEYLYAAFSLKRSTDEGLTPEQLDTVNRWRSTLLLVAKQEMMHLAINCNLLTSLGASPHLSRPNLPQPARHYPTGVNIALLPFGEEALRHFLYLERPEGIEMDDTEGLAAMAAAVACVADGDTFAPHLQEFQTVGHLYRSIEAGFRHLAAKLGEDQLLLGPAGAGARGDLFGWPELAPITTIDDVCRAIDTIVEMGEGACGDWRQSHFGRFLAILDEYLEMTQSGDVEVTRPVLPVLVRPPESGAVADLITDPVTARVADLCNIGYEVLLQLLFRLMCHVDESEEQIQTLADVSVSMMFDVIEPLAEILTTMPVGSDRPGRTAGPTFEMFYEPSLLPHRRAAWLLMAEHLADAAVIADAETERDPRLRPVAASLRDHAGRLRDQAV